MSRGTLLLAVGAVAVLGAWLAALFLLPIEPFSIGQAVAVVCVLFVLLARTTVARAVWFNVAFVALAFGAFDAYVERVILAQGKRQYFSHRRELFVPDDVLGVRPTPGSSTTARMTYKGVQVYDVVYTFDDSGLRVSPPDGPSAACALFFGDSFTFGAGVNDDQTMPYRTGVRAEGRFRVRNFGFSGYGPHQMLAAIESGFVERAARCRPLWAVFQTEYHHVVRAAGIWTWDRHGPRYIIGSDGRPVRAGNFDSDDDSVRVLRALEKSAVARELRNRSMEAGANDAAQEDVTLYRALVAESAKRLREIWPDLEFHVIYWDVYEVIGRYPLFEDGWRPEGASVHPISKILPPAEDYLRAYKLRDEVHPNAYAHDLIASYVAREILRAPSR